MVLFLKVKALERVMRREGVVRHFEIYGKSTRLYLVSGGLGREFLLTGYANNPRWEEDWLLVDYLSWLGYSRMADEVVGPGGRFDGVRLFGGTKVTRRYQTHLRHIRGLGLKLTEELKKYMDMAREI